MILSLKVALTERGIKMILSGAFRQQMCSKLSVGYNMAGTTTLEGKKLVPDAIFTIQVL